MRGPHNVTRFGSALLHQPTKQPPCKSSVLCKRHKRESMCKSQQGDNIKLWVTSEQTSAQKGDHEIGKQHIILTSCLKNAVNICMVMRTLMMMLTMMMMEVLSDPVLRKWLHPKLQQLSHCCQVHRNLCCLVVIITINSIIDQYLKYFWKALFATFHKMVVVTDRDRSTGGSLGFLSEV